MNARLCLGNSWSGNGADTNSDPLSCSKMTKAGLQKSVDLMPQKGPTKWKSDSGYWANALTYWSMNHSTFSLRIQGKINGSIAKYLYVGVR